MTAYIQLLILRLQYGLRIRIFSIFSILFSLYPTFDSASGVRSQNSNIFNIFNTILIFPVHTGFFSYPPISD